MAILKPSVHQIIDIYGMSKSLYKNTSLSAFLV